MRLCKLAVDVELAQHVSDRLGGVYRLTLFQWSCVVWVIRFVLKRSTGPATTFLIAAGYQQNVGLCYPVLGDGVNLGNVMSRIGAAF